MVCTLPCWWVLWCLPLLVCNSWPVAGHGGEFWCAPFANACSWIQWIRWSKCQLSVFMQPWSCSRWFCWWFDCNTSRFVSMQNLILKQLLKCGIRLCNISAHEEGVTDISYIHKLDVLATSGVDSLGYFVFWPNLRFVQSCVIEINLLQATLENRRPLRVGT